MKHHETGAPDDETADGPDDVDPPRAPLDAHSAHRIALRYREWSLLDGGGRAGRLEADRRIEDSEEVSQRVLYDLDPLPLLDALVALGVETDDDGAFLDRVSTGAVEDVLNHRADLHQQIADRCRAEPSWSEAVRGARIDDKLASRLPSPLPDLFPAPPPEVLGTGDRRRRNGRRPSLRQGRTGRRGGRTV
ncbi:hypothetical protein [Oerskovia enterophila]|uniref:Uncharacterized protein n=1 Tax=Oerskovia enterophila TaxID=43678 RepID=A0A163RIM7_9CELL|nr:hypothetical protein [Oerskovia enterophila]KZM35244.1 hypothetical protein OJAG_20320 [Oerskovia enterophila]OCI32020.1 hypothetical protein OERS_11720 [Oerskovia enterophila]